VDGDALPDITFTEADPPPLIEGLRTWPQIMKIKPNKLNTIHKITNLKTDIKKTIKANKNNRTKGILEDYSRRRETRALTSAYTRTHEPRTDAEGIPIK